VYPEKFDFDVVREKHIICEKHRFSVGYFSGMTGFDNGLTRVLREAAVGHLL
jgi:hypothetical protein